MVNPRYYKFAELLVYLLLIGLAVSFWFVTDDAYISFRYADNLSNGLGLRYNIGVDPAVEGYSNFLWVILTALMIKSGFHPDHIMPIISIFCGCCAVWQVKKILQKLELRPASILFAQILLATFPVFFFWSTGGLATMAFTLAWLTTLRFMMVDRSLVMAVLAGLALTLLRAEGIAWLILIAIASLLYQPKSGKRFVAVALLIIGLMFTVYIGWRFSYYGELLPNTVTNKVGFSLNRLLRGGSYFANFNLTFPFVTLAFCGLIPLLFRQFWLGASLLFLTLATLVYPVVVGGDFMAMFRFYLPAVPLLVISYALAVRNLGLKVQFLLCLIFVALNLAPAFNYHPVPESVRENFHIRFNTKDFRSEYDQWAYMKYNSERWQILGRGLSRIAADKASPNQSLVAGAIGNVGYFSGLRIYDRFGLVNREVARQEIKAKARKKSPGHEKSVQPEFYLENQPTYLYARLLRGYQEIDRIQLEKKLNRRYNRHGYHAVGYPLSAIDSRGNNLAIVTVEQVAPAAVISRVSNP